MFYLLGIFLFSPQSKLIYLKVSLHKASQVGQLVNNLPAMQETWVQSLGWKDPLEKGTATPVFWHEEFYGRYSPWGYRQWDTTE